jgi:hypothetical protein
MNSMPARLRNEKSVKLQSAMEYLMTYGWAILVIAVVLGVLFQLGVFNSGSFSIKAPPGSCQVFRPSGPWTNKNLNSVGVCTGQLPQYVLSEQGTSQIGIVSAPFLNVQTVTLSVWVKTSTTGWNNYVMKQAYSYNGFWFGTQPGTGGSAQAYFYMWSSGTLRNAQPWSGALMSDGKWHNLAVTYNGYFVSYYLDGASVFTNDYGTYLPIGPASQSLYLGTTSGQGTWQGQFSNVQMYNTSLSASDVQGIFTSGIGGAPTQLQNLVGWWPLNGNANDYSGNNNAGQAFGGTSYTTQWTSG